MADNTFNRRIFSLDNWLEMNKNSEHAMIQDLLPSEAGEYMFISGRTGIGKSMLVTHLAFCLATGTPFFHFNCDRVKVGHLAMEGGRNNIIDRLTKIMQLYPRNLWKDNYCFELQQPLQLDKRVDDFKTFFKGCQVVIADNLRQLTTGKYLETTYASTWIKTYQQALIDIGAVGILTCHIKKPSTNGLWEAGDVYDLKGATEYVDASTSVLLLERTRQGRSNDGRGFGKVDKDKVTLHFAKTRIALRDLEPLELQRNFDRGSFDVIT